MSVERNSFEPCMFLIFQSALDRFLDLKRVRKIRNNAIKLWYRAGEVTVKKLKKAIFLGFLTFLNVQALEIYF